ncbi:MAG: ADP-ribosylglycohydrolase family protein [Prevotella sp.]|nr:ADP-ribosylglycohydrolase family protein [Bacteroides sp.]MCM1366704.1 ADP-ribosylglycohydrolase family protein [Prevotella sp.]MCM1437282.1 ADP-ribosylglycohydrolase family protein [Prevotella sp.]
MKELTLQDKIMGAMYGYAIGDALGVAGEFMTKTEVAMRYPDGIRRYDQIFRDAHRSQWLPGEWTSDTEIVLRMLYSLLEEDRYSINAVARKFKEWYEEGYPDLVPQYRFIFADPNYVNNPEEVAYHVWKEMGGIDASNEALGRAAFTGMAGEHYIEIGAELCAITHPDPRCVGCSIVISRLAHDLMWHRRITDEDTLVRLARPVDDRIIPYIRWAKHETLDPFDLDDEDTLWYVRKAMGASLWCIWHELSAMEAFDAIVSEGGDADTNAALALALIGIRDGVEAFPKELRDTLVGKRKLEETGLKLIEYFKKNVRHP